MTCETHDEAVAELLALVDESYGLSYAEWVTALRAAANNLEQDLSEAEKEYSQ